jgi:hypothetical protein
MSLYQDQRSSSRSAGDGAGCAPPPTHGQSAGGVAGSYLRLTGPVLRGPAGVAVAVAGFAAALVPGPALAWHRTSMEAAVPMVTLAVGYRLEWAVASNTGRRALR